jgi:uncharacterized linocin/CFP29 family protein
MKHLLTSDGRLDVNAGRVWLDPKYEGRAFMMRNGQVVEASPALAANALLRRDEWISFDNTILQTVGMRLTGIADLRAGGLVYNAGNLGTSFVEWNTGGDMTDAEANMSGTVVTEKDLGEFGTDGVPIPIIRKDFAIPLRAILASRNNGAGIDVFNAQLAARKVAEKSEQILFLGAGITLASRTLYGYTNHPQRNIGDLEYDWAAEVTTGANILSDVRAMKLALQLDGYRGPYTIYLGASYYSKLSNDYSTVKGDNTILQRILAEEGIAAVKLADAMPDDAVVMVQLTSDVIDLAVAQDVTNLQWSRGDGMVENFAVLAAWAPRIKAGYNGESGVAHFTFSST